MAADPSRRRPEHHPAVNDVMSTLTDASNTLADVQHRLNLELRAAYPDHANPAKLVARVKQLEKEAVALKEMSRVVITQKQVVASFPYVLTDLLPMLRVYPQELMDQIRVSLMAQRGMTQRLLAASGLPPMSDADEAVHNSLNEVIQDWTAQVVPITREVEDLDKKKDANQILFSTII